MTSIPASRRARAMILAPRSWPSRPGFATTTRIFRVTVSGIRRRILWVRVRGRDVCLLHAQLHVHPRVNRAEDGVQAALAHHAPVDVALVADARVELDRALLDDDVVDHVAAP